MGPQKRSIKAALGGGRGGWGRGTSEKIFQMELFSGEGWVCVCSGGEV